MVYTRERRPCRSSAVTSAWRSLRGIKDRRLQLRNTVAWYVVSRRSRQTSLPINRPTLTISGHFSKTIETAHVNRRLMNFFARDKCVKNRGLSARIYASMTMVNSAVATFSKRFLSVC